VTDEHIERREPGSTPVLRTRVELWLVVTLMAATFVVGLVLGLLAGVREQPDDSPSQEQAPAAPPITEDQVGQTLPPGHPSLSPPMEAVSPGASG